MFTYINSLLYLTGNHYTNEQKHSVARKLYEVFHLIHENDDFGYMEEDRLGRLCFRMAQDSVASGEYERALDELEEMLEHFDKMNSFTEIKQTSLLLNTLSADKTTVKKHCEENIYATFKYYINRCENTFKPLENMDRFIAVKQQLTNKTNVK